ncbi:hypothetical protein HWC35_gp178 [Vibrio phage USC-1]|uniref:HD domain-containing protein n=2 Tax=Aphroditevirus USC1 TaxID=2846605 RepID=A0A514A2Y0_9CAUD|nr:hypothetical protein HWC35_gp178 [Vibrio phage USC-1]QCW23156.1 hypothetical protein [Vibrio phage 5 TSL-2019]QDH47572.1 hypothetical protein [Vibrio phage USC-1]
MKERIEKYQARFLWLAEQAGIKVNHQIVQFCTISNNKNDPAHNLEHILGVIRLGVELGIKKGYYGTNEMKIIYYGCLMHDLGCRWDRAGHHVESAAIAEELLSVFDSDMTEKEIEEISRCCLEHRSSYRGGPTTELSTLVALSDRGKPNFPLYVMRAFQFRIKEELTQKQMTSEVYHHLLDKFGKTEGYNWISYPTLGMDLFAEEWKEFDRLLLRKNVNSLVNTYTEQFLKYGKVHPVETIDRQYMGLWGKRNNNRKIKFRG